ncbi:hypothetical protein IB265_33050 [Ensifer sp. ENS10]|uniref:hypothetical protein n=1 Tax=Ensifer sp. ENS10 TaxID=2769286 RepID=UPI001781E1E4|nr:hypothetical protein [Ensifer sp. ENS10]MBD9511586.1 hypothetical protein [Ensifer sp. ENS10]
MSHQKPFETPTTPYEEGMNSASYCDGGDTEPCPYPADSAEAEAWHDGFGQWTDDEIEWSRRE